MLTNRALSVGNGVFDVSFILYLICMTDLSFYINPCVTLLNKFTKQEIKLEIFVAVCWSVGKWCKSIVRRSVPLVDHSLGFSPVV